MGGPAETSSTDPLQKISAAEAIPRFSKSEKQSQKTVQGPPFLGGASPHYAVFVSSPSSTSAGTTGLLSRPCALDLSKASAADHTPGIDRRPPCWTFLPVGGLEARTKRGNIGKIHSVTKVAASSAAPSSEDDKTHPSLSQPNAPSQSWSSSKPPTFEQLLCTSTDEEKETAVSFQRTKTNNNSSDPGAAAPTFQGKQANETLYLAPSLALAGEASRTVRCALSSPGKSHSRQANTRDVRAEEKFKEEQGVAARKASRRCGCREKRTAPRTKREKGVSVVPAGMRRLPFLHRFFASGGDDAKLACARLHNPRKSRPLERTQSSSSATLSPKEGKYSPDLRKANIFLQSGAESVAAAPLGVTPSVSCSRERISFRRSKDSEDRRDNLVPYSTGRKHRHSNCRRIGLTKSVVACEAHAKHAISDVEVSASDTLTSKAKSKRSSKLVKELRRFHANADNCAQLHPTDEDSIETSSASAKKSKREGRQRRVKGQQEKESRAHLCSCRRPLAEAMYMLSNIRRRPRTSQSLEWPQRRTHHEREAQQPQKGACTDSEAPSKRGTTCSNQRSSPAGNALEKDNGNVKIKPRMDRKAKLIIESCAGLGGKFREGSDATNVDNREVRRKEKHNQIFQLTIPPHPLFIPTLRLSLLKTHRKKQVLVEQRSGEDIAAESNNSRIASTCTRDGSVESTPAEGSSDEEDADDETKSVRRERSLLASLFTLQSSSSPSHKQQLRRTINRYALVRLYSDEGTPTEEEEGSDNTTTNCRTNRRPIKPLPVPQADFSNEMKAQRPETGTELTSSASPAPTGGDPPGKAKPLLPLRLLPLEECSSHPERRSRSLKGIGQTSSASSNCGSGFHGMRHSCCRAVAEHFSRSFSDNLTPRLLGNPVAGRRSSTTGATTKTQKNEFNLDGGAHRAVHQLFLRTPASAAQSYAGKTLASRRNLHRGTKILIPQNSKAAPALLASGRNDDIPPDDHSSLCEKALSPTNARARKTNGQSDPDAHIQLSERERWLPYKDLCKLGFESVSAAPSVELLLKTHEFPAHEKNCILRTLPWKRRCNKRNYSFPVCYNTAASTVGEAGEHGQSPDLRRGAHSLRRRSYPRGNAYCEEKVDRRGTGTSRGGDADSPHSEAPTWSHYLALRAPTLEAFCPTVCGEGVAALRSLAEEETIKAQVTFDWASTASGNTNEGVTRTHVSADRAPRTKSPQADTFLHESNNTSTQLQSGVEVAMNKERDTRVFSWALGPALHPVRRQVNRTRQPQQEDQVDAAVWEDLRVSRYNNKTTKKDQPARRSCGFPTKAENIASLSGRLHARGAQAAAAQSPDSWHTHEVIPVPDRQWSSAKLQDPSCNVDLQESMRSFPQHTGGEFSLSESGGSSEADIPSAFDTIWKRSFRRS